MSVRQIYCVVILSFAISAHVPAQYTGGLPVVAGPDPLEWTPASELVGFNDWPRWSERSEESLEVLRAKGLATRGEPCIPMHNILDGNSGPRASTLDEVVGSAAVVVVGEVVSAEPGFVEETPGIMLEIRAEELTGAVSWTRGDPLFVFFEGGRIPVGDEVLCVILSGFSTAPQSGDYLLLFPLPWDLERQLERRRSFLTIDGGPNERTMFWSEALGGFHASSDLLLAVPEISSDRDLSSFLGSVRAAVERVRR